jgi:Na+-transporting NADH:ubiquinone oxidoreductase subunit NqrE
MKIKNFIKKIYLGLAFIPSLALAFSLGSSTFGDIVKEVLSIIGLLIPLMFAVAFVVFFWGLSKFILHSDSKADIEAGKNYMFWGIIALFVLVTFRAIIAAITGDLDLGPSQTAPQLKTSLAPVTKVVTLADDFSFYS